MMIEQPQKTLLKWLNNAYVMERGMERILSQYVDDADGETGLQFRLAKHLQATGRQAELLKQRLEELGGQPANIRARLADMAGFMQGIMTGGGEDELIQDLLSLYAAKHYEMAAYKNLLVAAETLRDWETVNLCLEIYRQEEEMAEWVKAELTEKAEQFVVKRAGVPV